MPKPRKAWTFSPGKKPKSALPGTLKDEVDTKARELIETVLKPKHVQPPPKDEQLQLRHGHHDQVARLEVLLRVDLRLPRPERHLANLRRRSSPGWSTSVTASSPWRS